MLYELGEFVQTQMPSYYLDEFPRFVSLMKNYYKWLYRKDGMTEDEIEDVETHIYEWTEVDMDKFIETGSVRYNSFDGANQTSVAEISRWRAPGAIIERFHSQYLLEREYDAFVTADGEYFYDKDGAGLETSYIMEEAIDGWASKFKHIRFKDATAVNPYDEILLLKSMKMLYAAKGTEKCIKLFFKVYFDEDVEIYIPKFDIALIDGAEPMIDTEQIIRDDRYYQEYCYVIRTEQDPVNYKDVFENIYMQDFHPGGFAVFLEQKQP